LPAQAQEAAPPDLKRDGDTLTLDALGQRLALPLPSWLDAAEVDAAALASAAETRFTLTDTQASLMLYPRAEGEGFWTTRMGALNTLDDTPNLKAYRDVVIIGYAQVCKPEATAFFQLTPDEDDSLPPLGLACGSYADIVRGYQGKGEVVVMRFLKTDLGVGLVFQEWLGRAFDPADAQSWPVTTETVQQRIDTFGQSTALALVD
jgi:hypothetical protein